MEDLDPRIRRELLKEELLQMWATKNLAQRVALIKEDFNLDLSVYKLRRLYLSHGIRPRST